MSQGGEGHPYSTAGQGPCPVHLGQVAQPVVLNQARPLELGSRGKTCRLGPSRSGEGCSLEPGSAPGGEIQPLKARVPSLWEPALGCCLCSLGLRPFQGSSQPPPEPLLSCMKISPLWLERRFSGFGPGSLSYLAAPGDIPLQILPQSQAVVLLLLPNPVPPETSQQPGSLQSGCSPAGNYTEAAKRKQRRLGSSEKPQNWKSLNVCNPGSTARLPLCLCFFNFKQSS